MKDAQISTDPAVIKDGQALELLPCPFCGMSDPSSEIVRAYGKSQWRSKMHCTSCGASSGWSALMDHDQSAKAAIEIWNMRANSVPLSLQSKKASIGRG
jgi:restriction alleviation protein, Lar family